jgi:hypothetical protein
VTAQVKPKLLFQALAGILLWLCMSTKLNAQLPQNFSEGTETDSQNETIKGPIDLSKLILAKAFIDQFPLGQLFPVVKKTVPVKSGPGAAWGQWAIITSDPRPGYRLLSASFHTEGDRPCQGDEQHPIGAGSWAECRQVNFSRDEATWTFRLQGWSDRVGGYNVATDIGVLTTFWAKDNPAPVFEVTVTTPEVWSGHGIKFGCAADRQYADRGWWCKITAPPPPDTHRISAVRFELVGDRQCKGDEKHPQPTCAYANARQSQLTDTSAAWEFQMQGHEDIIEPIETLGGGVRNGGASRASRGILTVTYRRRSESASTP